MLSFPSSMKDVMGSGPEAPPTYYTQKQRFHYWYAPRPSPPTKHPFPFHRMSIYRSFWTLSSVMSGVGIGVLSFLRRRRYRKWVLRQPKEEQLAILKHNQGETSSNVPKSRFSHLPHAIDTRPIIAFSGDLRPSAWWEFGPLKFWNQKSVYPWASELVNETTKWGVRISLMTAMTLFLEIGACAYLMIPLGQNILLRGGSGALSGWFLSRAASEGMLSYFQSFYMALGMGIGWALITMWEPGSYHIAERNETVLAQWLVK